MSVEGTRSLPRPVATAFIAAFLACAAAAWLVTAQQAASMAGMGGMAAGLFLVLWVVMMVAMMFPALASMVLAHAGAVRSRSLLVLGSWLTFTTEHTLALEALET